MTIRSVGLAGALTLLVTQQALAIVVNAPTVIPQSSTVFTQVYNGNTSSSSFSSGLSTLTTGGLSATATANIQPSPHETVSASVNGQGSSYASSALTYYFGVNANNR